MNRLTNDTANEKKWGWLSFRLNIPQAHQLYRGILKGCDTILSTVVTSSSYTGHEVNDDNRDTSTSPLCEVFIVLVPDLLRWRAELWTLITNL